MKGHVNPRAVVSVD